MGYPATRYLLYAQLSLVVGLVLGVVLAPESLTLNEGLSYLGVNKETLLPFYIGLMVATLFMVLGIKHLPAFNHSIVVSRFFNYFLVMVLGVLLTPYVLGWIFGVMHALFTTGLFLGQFLFALWIVFALERSRLNIILTATLLVSGLFILLALIGALPFLLQAQVVFQLAFWTMVTHMIYRIENFRSPTHAYLFILRTRTSPRFWPLFFRRIHH